VTIATRPLRRPGRKIIGPAPLFLHHHILSAADERPTACLGNDYFRTTLAAHVSLAHLV
jgi:hypothetical protein